MARLAGRLARILRMPRRLSTRIVCPSIRGEPTMGATLRFRCWISPEERDALRVVWFRMPRRLTLSGAPSRGTAGGRDAPWSRVPRVPSEGVVVPGVGSHGLSYVVSADDVGSHLVCRATLTGKSGDAVTECLASTSPVAVPDEARALVREALEDGNAIVEVETLTENDARTCAGSVFGSERDDGGDVNAMRGARRSKLLTLALHRGGVRVISLEGRVKEDVPYSSNTSVRPVGRRSLALRVGAPERAGGRTSARLRHCRAPSRAARDLLVITFRAFSMGASGAHLEPCSKRSAVTGGSVEEDMREVEAALRAEEKAIGAARNAAAAAAGAKKTRLMEAAGLTNIPSKALLGLAETYGQIAATIAALPMPTWDR